MIANRLARYPLVWAIAAIACNCSASLGTAVTQVQALEEKATAVEEWVVFRLIDEEGRPVAGAKMGRSVGLDDPRLDGKQLDWNERATSDENGQVAIRRVDVFTWGMDKTAPYILHEGRGIGATPEIPHKHTGERPPIVLTPVCRVRGTLSVEDVPQTDIPLEGIHFIVHTANTYNWMLHGGVSAEEKRGFDLLLPAGKYSLSADALEKGPQGSYIGDKVRHEMRTFAVAPGQQDLDLA